MPVDHRLGLDQATKLLSTAGLEPDLSHDQLRRISDYFEARRQWSNTHNLAGPKARTDPWNIDLIDAYALSQLAEETDALVDVGTGSGTPGLLLLGCLNPRLTIVLIEPLAKRTAFLRQTVARLGLEGVQVIRNRWPAHVSHETYQIVSRAVVSPSEWPVLATSEKQSRGSFLECWLKFVLNGRHQTTAKPPLPIIGSQLTMNESSKNG